MFTYKCKEITIYDSLQNVRKKQVFIVKTSFEIPNLMLPSPLTYFVLKYGKSYNTQRKYAQELCGFINYIIIKTQSNNSELYAALRMKGLSELNFYHLADYINHISNNPEKQISFDTVKLKQDVLYLFYSYLNGLKINIQNEKIFNELKLLNSQGYSNRTKKKTPFDLCQDIFISYPSHFSKKNDVLKDMPEELWALFIEYAEEHYPNLVFGLILNICGGVRRGECVNLRVKDVKLYKNNHSIYLNIKDNQEELFGDRDININNSQVKKVRKKQPVLPLYSRIQEIFNEHKKYLMKVYNTQHIENKAFFVNADGKPMSGDSYGEYFKNLKLDFIAFLESEGLPALAQQLREYRWESHIGRHIFTNAIVKNGYANGSGNKPIPKLVAILRGDSSEDSSNEYIDNYTISEAVSKNINDISTIATEYENND